ncbi:MAG: hypothetical protein LBM77_10040 [Spirochaetaceae bacterium]|jgi:nitroreductase|nr:hypothetical protein [Spirochaetaceae bacterium]
MWTDEELNELNREIYRRKSVRSYKSEELPVGVKERILDAAKNKAVPLNQCACVFKLLNEADVEKPFGGAPHFLATYTEQGMANEDEALNAAFLMQEMSLYLSDAGIGSCWLGMAKAKKDFMEITEEGKKMQFCKMMAIGYGSQEIYRDNLNQFNRKAISAISNLKGLDSLLEAAGLAPSAVNQQAWFWSGEPSEMSAGMPKRLRLFSGNANILMNSFLKPLQTLDSGIALAHLWIAANKEKKFKGFLDENGVKPPKKGLRYIKTLQLM